MSFVEKDADNPHHQPTQRELAEMQETSRLALRSARARINDIDEITRFKEIPEEPVTSDPELRVHEISQSLIHRSSNIKYPEDWLKRISGDY